MKRRYFFLFIIPAVLILFNTKNAESQTGEVTTFILSNEAPGHLIDSLISRGWGWGTLYENLLSLQDASGGIISDEFLEVLEDNPQGSEIFTKKLSDYAGLNGSIAINSDGSVKSVFIYGQDYYQKKGYQTYPNFFAASPGREIFTYATSPEYYIDAGTGSGGKHYKAFAIAWSMETAPSTFVISNEKPGCLIDSLIAAGYDGASLFDALVSIQEASGSIIPDEFLETLAGNPPGSDIFIKPLSNFASLDSGIAINTDGTYKLVSIKGKNYYKKEGYATYPETSTGTGRELFTYATSPEYYIDAGTGAGGKHYKAFAIAWSKGNTTDTSTALTFMLSNEAPGYLIDNLIANGYGDSSLYAVMVALQPVSCGVIRQSFLDTLKACPAGSDIFTGKLKYFTGANNPVGINYDGTILISGIYGKDYFQKQGYTTGTSSSVPVELKLFTSADSPEYLIDTGEPCLDINKTGNYKAFTIAWSRGSTVVISNEAPGYLIDTLIAKGYGNKNLFEVLSALQPVSGGSIPDNYIKQLAALPQSSEIFTSKLYEFAGNNNPVCINADGKVNINPIYAKGFDQKENYTTCRDNHPTIGRAVFTYAISHEFYIDAGFGNANENYRVFTIVWSDNVTSIQEHNEVQKSVSIYPNPFSEGINISNLDSPAQIEIYDILGRNAYAGKIECDGYLALPGLTDGIYWISISSGRDTYQQILVKTE